jgi:hypothetical protein
VGLEFRQLNATPEIGFALLIKRNGVRPAPDLLAVLFPVDIIVDPPYTGTGWRSNNPRVFFGWSLIAFPSWCMFTLTDSYIQSVVTCTNQHQALNAAAMQ